MDQSTQYFQEACYDLCSIALRTLSLPTKNPVMRRYYLEQVVGTLEFESDTLLLKVTLGHQTKCIAILSIYLLQPNYKTTQGLILTYKKLLESKDFLGLGLRDKKIDELVESLFKETTKLTQAKALKDSEDDVYLQTFKRTFIQMFYTILKLNLHLDLL